MPAQDFGNAVYFSWKAEAQSVKSAKRTRWRVMENRHIVIFDGVCRFCSGAVRFIIKRDPRGQFAFTPSQSVRAQQLMEQHAQTGSGLDTLILIKNGVCYLRSDAVLEIIKDLSGAWFLFGVFRVLPRTVRDFSYRVFARYRYSVFGKRESCMIPTREISSRFLD